MNYIKTKIIENKNEMMVFKKATGFVTAGQSTQIIVGATPDNDRKIINLSESLYDKYKLKRVFYSAFIRVNDDSALPALPSGPPLLREHRLYQADWLLRFYGFKAQELLSEENPNFNVLLDPKCDWAVRNLQCFPIEVNKADYYTLMRVPGIGKTSATRIISARRTTRLSFSDLRKLGVVLKRAQFFITCDGKLLYKFNMNEDFITTNLVHQKDMLPSVTGKGEKIKVKQLSLFDDEKFTALPDRNDKILSLTGEI
jgi:predicted DNA-binding helix-hairpin-helix protein